ncbi:MAG: hypothetical protein HFH72_12530 [Lachnospiraceae bacterium]|jgi:hypothetical protein|nr:hypothetical protein [Lachnospiraceae bacterium]RKI25221.1 hypothetical protein D7V72_15125 [bacterium D16-36]RKI67253.1 hypothetical protein D7V82_13465 [bacterium 1xD8-6]
MKQKSKELKDEMYEWLLSEIRAAQVTGVPVAVDGKIYSIKEADELKGVMENHYYMKSYTGDEFGKIVRIDFDHITSV